MMPSESSKLVTLMATICALFLFIMVAEAQSDNLDIGINEAGGNARQPVSDSSASYGIPYSSVLRDMTLTSPQPLNPVHGGVSDISNIGPNGGFGLYGDFSGMNHLSLPLASGTISRKQLHLGRLDFHVTSISGTVLASDNIHASENNHQYGAIAIMRAQLDVEAQLTERLIFRTEIRFFYLPFVNKGGIIGFSGASPIADLAFSPLGGAEMAYNGQLAGWDLQVYDTFGMSALQAGASVQFPVDYGFSTPREADQAGRYVFADGTDIPPSGNSRFNEGSVENSFLSLRNTTGFLLSKVVPTETRLDFGGQHKVSWYKGDHGLVPHSSDVLFASATSVRENLRFKPSLDYSQSRVNFNPDWSHRIQGTVNGPLSEYTDVNGAVGYFWRDSDNLTTMTYQGGINHVLGPYTSEVFRFGQVVTEPVEEKVQYYRYHILQILGPDLSGQAMAGYSKFSSFEHGVFSSTEEYAGASIDYVPSPLSRFRFSVNYIKVQSENAAQDQYSAWRGRIDFYRRMFQTVRLNASYIYQKNESSRAGGSYDENLLVLTVTKTF